MSEYTHLESRIVATDSRTGARGQSLIGGGGCSSALRLALLVSGSTMLLLPALAGCEKPLFPPHSDRTQFDQYDKLHGEFVPEDQYDQFGKPESNLRERLLRNG